MVCLHLHNAIALYCFDWNENLLITFAYPSNRRAFYGPELHQWSAAMNLQISCRCLPYLGQAQYTLPLQKYLVKPSWELQISSSSVFLNLLVFWQNWSIKFSDPMLSVNLDYFNIKNKMQNFIKSSPSKINLLRLWPLLKKLYKICTDNYDNNEYLAVKCIRFFSNDIICL